MTAWMKKRKKSVKIKNIKRNKIFFPMRLMTMAEETLLNDVINRRGKWVLATWRDSQSECKSTCCKTQKTHKKIIRYNRFPRQINFLVVRVGIFLWDVPRRALEEIMLIAMIYSATNYQDKH
jgi:hypothetical protein